MRRVHAWVTEIGKTLMRGWAESLRGLWGKELAILGFTTAKTIWRFGLFFLPAAAIFGCSYVLLSEQICPFRFLGMQGIQTILFSRASSLFQYEGSIVRMMIPLFILVVPLILVFMAVATARPSLARKDGRYYLSCFKRGFAPFLLSWLVLPQMFISEALLWFFLLDGPEKGWRKLVYAFGRTVAFHLMFLPAICIINLVVMSLEKVGLYFFALLMSMRIPLGMRIPFPGNLLLLAVITFPLALIVIGTLIISLSLLSSLYVKYKHRYHDLFFGKA